MSAPMRIGVIARPDVDDMEEFEKYLAGHRYRASRANIVMVDGLD